MKEQKWYLIYFYHDCFYNEYYEINKLYHDLKVLKERYKYDSDFHYKVICGEEIDSSEIN